MTRKVLSILLSLMMVFSLMPGLAYAAEGDADQQDSQATEAVAEEPEYNDEPTEEELQEFMIEDVIMEGNEGTEPGEFVEIEELTSEEIGEQEDLGSLPDDDEFVELTEVNEASDGIFTDDFITEEELNSAEMPEDDGDSVEGYEIVDMPSEEVEEGGDVPPEEGELPPGDEGDEELGALIDLSKFGHLTNIPSVVTVGGHYSVKLSHEGKGNAYALKMSDTDQSICNVCIDNNGYLVFDANKPGSTYVTVKLVIKVVGLNILTLDTAKIRIDVPKVTMSKDTLNITKGSAGQVSFTYSGITEKQRKVDFQVSITNYENVDVKWSGWSGKTKKMTITGKKAGTSYIRVNLQSTSPTYYYLGGYVTLKVTVAPKPYVTLSNTSLRLKKGESREITATAKDTSGLVYFTVASNNTSAFGITPVSLASSPVKYRVTGKDLGTGNITINMRSVLTSKVIASATLSVTVYDNPKVTLSQSSVSVNVRSSAQIKCTASGVAGAYSFSIAPSAQFTKMNASIGARSGNSSVITITGTNAGTETLYVYLRDQAGVIMTYAAVTVNVKAVAKPSLKLNTSSLSVYQGSSAQIKGTMSNMPGDKKYIKVDWDDDNICGVTVQWSGNTPIMTVTGKNTGSCGFTFRIMRASDNTQLASATGTIKVVKPDKIHSISYKFNNSTVTSAMKNPSMKVCNYMYTGEMAKLVYNGYLETYKKGGLGFCYGMSSTSGLMYIQGNGIYPSTFSSGKSIVNQLAYTDKNNSLGINIGEFIQAMQISQISTTSNMHHGCTLQDYVTAVKRDVNNGKVIPVHMWWYNAKNEKVGHTVLAYGVENVDSTHERILIYENNNPEKTQYVNLTKDGSGNYTNWSYTRKYSNKTIQQSNAILGYSTFDNITDLWGHRGNTSSNGTLNQYNYTEDTGEAAGSDGTPDISISNMVAINSQNFVIKDVDNNIVAEIKDGELVTDKEDVFIQNYAEYNEDSNDNVVMTYIYLPTDVYTFQNNDEDAASFYVGIADQELSTIVTTTGDEITVCADDESDLASAMLMNAADGEEYSIVLGSSREGEPAEVIYEGVGTGDTISIASLNGTLDVCNAENAVMSVSEEVNGETNQQVFTVSAIAEEGGSISPEGNDRIWAGDDQKYVITPDPGFKIADVTVDGKSVGAVSSYTFKDVKESHTITATFADDSNIASAKVSGLKNFTYTGKALTQKPVVKLSGRTLTQGEDYTVTYKNNKNAGLASMIITGKGAYKGKLTKTFKINPKGTSVAKVTAAKKGFTVKWKAQKTKMAKSRVTGYQVQYSLSKTFKSGIKSKLVKGYKKTSLKVSKLKAKKKYYVRVRTYIKVKGKTYYSPWSKTKDIKTK